MTTFMIPDQLADSIQRQAIEQGQTVEGLLEAMLWREKMLVDRRKIEQEQEWWMNLPLSERAKYEGRFVAVHQKKLVDFDEDETILTRRIRAKYGDIAVLVMPAEGVRDIILRNYRVS